MGWEIGYDENWQRDIGYGVPCVCDYPGCEARIHRGLSYVCGGEPYGGEHGCGLYFCDDHLGNALYGPQLCERCQIEDEPFDPKPDTDEWINHKLENWSWGMWRDENPEEVERLEERQRARQ